MNRTKKRHVGETVFFIICICLIVSAVVLMFTHKKIGYIGTVEIKDQTNQITELLPQEIEEVKGKRITRISERIDPVEYKNIKEILYSKEMVTSITSLISRTDAVTAVPDNVSSGGTLPSESSVTTEITAGRKIVSTSTNVLIKGRYTGKAVYTVYNSSGVQINTGNSLVLETDENEEVLFVRITVLWGDEKKYTETDYFFKCVFI